MKVLIYLGCFFLESLAIVLIKYATGFDFLGSGALPAIFIVACQLWLSAYLCRKWDDYKERKAIKKGENNNYTQKGKG